MNKASLYSQEHFKDSGVGTKAGAIIKPTPQANFSKLAAYYNPVKIMDKYPREKFYQVTKSLSHKFL